MKVIVKRAVLLVMCAVLLTGMLSACGGNSGGGVASPGTGSVAPPSDSSAPPADEWVSRTVGITGSLGSLLQAGTVRENEQLLTLIYDNLWMVDPITKEIHSDILEDWYYEDDLTFVAKLKDGVYFSNGVKATAEDVVFSGSNLILRGSNKANQFGPMDVEASHTRDEFTAVFKFTKPWGPGIMVYNTPFMCKSWCEEVGWDAQEWITGPVGSGPYKVVDYVADSHYTLQLRDDYWDKSKDFFVDEWTMRFFPDASTMAMELEQGNIDVIAGMLPTDYERFLAEGASMGIGVRTQSMNDVYLMTFGFVNNPIFFDINVRKAIAHGVDWNVVGETGYGRLHSEPGGTLPKISPFYLNTGTYAFDPDLSKQLLADAGYSPGDIVIRCVQMDIARTKRMSESLQYYLDKIGIVVELEFNDIPSTLRLWTTPGNNDIGWQNNPSGTVAGEPFQSWFQLARSTGIFFHGFIEDDYFNELFDKATYTTDNALRKQTYHEVQQHMFDNYLVIPVSEYQTARAYRLDVFSDKDIEKAMCDEAVLYLNKLSVR